MTTTINLLIIEDEPAQIQSYTDNIDSHNKKNDIQFTYDVCDNFEKGKLALETPNYDAAIIDLKLSGSETLEGRTLLESIYQKIRIPIVVYSGSIAQINDIEENALLIKKSRTDSFKDVLSETIKIYKTGITSFLKPSGSVDKKLTDIFWNHLAVDIETWIENNNQDTLLRYILSHFQEHLEMNVDGDFEEYHPFEVYIKPPIKKNLHTGDLIKFKGLTYVILSPACDIVLRSRLESDGSRTIFRNADKIILVKAQNFDVLNFCLKNGKLNKDRIDSFVWNKSLRYHYLPPLNGNQGFIIDFQDIKSVDNGESLERIASISSAFIKDIISRFANYYSRQGQPTFNQNAIVSELFANGVKAIKSQESEG